MQIFPYLAGISLARALNRREGGMEANLSLYMQMP